LQSTRNTKDRPINANQGPFEWKHVLVLSVAIACIVLIVVMIVQQTFIPPIAIFVVLALIGAFLVRTRERAGAIMLAIVSVLFLVLNLPFILPSLSVHESSVDFLATTLTLLSLIAMIVSSVAILRRRSGANAMRFSIVITVLGVLAVAGTAVARLAYEEAEAQPGDIEMVLENIEFSPQTITAEEGVEISVFLENKDTVLHTFTIEELDVDVDVPGNGSARVTFDAEPGRYEFICEPHQPDMDGTLRVGS
jgi:plastocyanin